MRKKNHAVLDPSEEQIQASVIAWCRAQHQQRPGMETAFHVPNYRRIAGSGHERALHVAKLRKQGFSDGVPDLFLDIPRGGWHGLRLELKSASGRLTPAQKAWLAHYEKHGYAAAVSIGVDQTIGYLEAYYDGLWRPP